jgi:putative ABC transport system substrate-binding protein
VNPVKGRLPILLGLVAVSLAAIPATANAQLAGKPHRVGVLHLGPRAAVERYDKILEAGLRESRYAVGEHIVLEYRFADGQRQRLTDLASELVALQVDAIVVSSNVETEAARHATGVVSLLMWKMPARLPV